MKKLLLIMILSMLTNMAACAPEATFHVVEFDSNGGTEVDPKAVIEGEMVERPTDPNRTGYNFIGWYTNLSFDRRFNFYKAIEEPTIIYAKWTPRIYTIRFEDNEGNLIKYYQFEYNSDLTTLEYPEPPDKRGLKFVSWDYQLPDRMPATHLVITANYILDKETDI